MRGVTLFCRCGCWLGLLLATAATPLHAQRLEFVSGGGTVTLSVANATAGSEPDDATDASGLLYWDALFGVTAKLTVGTLCPGQRFSLYVALEVTSWADGTGGSVQPEVELLDGMLDADLLRDIPPTDPERKGYGRLTYRAAATVAQGTSNEYGEDYHTITFTLLEQ